MCNAPFLEGRLGYTCRAADFLRRYSFIGYAVCFCILLSAAMIVVDFISVKRHSEMVQFVANSAALSAAEGLPMFESPREEIQQVRRGLSGCQGETTEISSVGHEIDQIDLMITIPDDLTSVKVIANTQSMSIFGDYSLFGSVSFSANSEAVLIGSGRAVITTENPKPNWANLISRSSSGRLRHCDV